jgi:hypothetical protein
MGIKNPDKYSDKQDTAHIESGFGDSKVDVVLKYIPAKKDNKLKRFASFFWEFDDNPKHASIDATIVYGASGVTGYTKYIRMQTHSTSSTPAGAGATKTLTFQYDES